MNTQHESSQSHMAGSNLRLGKLWVPLLFGSSIALVTLVVWQGLVTQDRADVNRLLSTHAGSIQRAIQRDFEIRIPDLQRMADRWVMKGGTPKPEWEADAKNYLKDIPGFQALEWVDSNLVVRWIVPFEGNEGAKDLLLTFEGRRKMALEASLKSRHAVLTLPIDLVQGRKGFLIVFPLFIENRFDGFILGVFRIQEWINDVMKEFLISDWGVAIFVEGEEVFTSQPHPQRLALERAIDREFRVQNRLWNVRVWPLGSLLGETTSTLPTVAMIVGLFVAGLTGITIRMAQTARWRLKAVEVSNVKLENEVSAKEKAFEALRESEARLQAVLDGSSSVIYVKDLDGRYLLINRRFEMLFNLARDEINGLTDFDIFPPETAAEFQLNDRKALEAPEPLSIEETAPHLDGPHIYISNKFPFFNEAGEPYAICGISTDITIRKWGEEALRENLRLLGFDARISHILAHGENLHDILHGCTKTMVSDLGAAFARIWTLNEHEDMLELQASSGLYTHLDGTHSRVPVGQFKIGMIASECKPHLTNTVIGDSRVPEQEWAKRQGLVAFAGYPILLQGRAIGVMAMFARHPLPEFTLKMLESVADRIGLGIERKRTEKALQKSEHDLWDALNERTRISQDLHDNILQSLYAVGLLIVAAKKPSAEGHHTEVETYLDQSISQLNRAIEEIRKFIRSLYSGSGAKINLYEELTMLVQAMKLSNSTKFELFVDPDADQSLTNDQKTQVLNIAREALRNSCQHAQATGGLVRLALREQGFLFEVKDNGKGFYANAQRSKGFGMSNMGTRAQAIGGILTVRSSPNQGTHILVTVAQNEEIASDS